MNPADFIEWKISIGTIVQLISFLTAAAWFFVKLLRRLDIIEQWMKDAPKKEDFVAIQTKIEAMWEWFTTTLERRHQDHR